MPAVIELKSVTKTYKLGDEVLNALDKVNFTVQPGEFIAIVGPSVRANRRWPTSSAAWIGRPTAR
jgi:ABC-type phosphate/phosphonate transport system ATPase subunit